VFSVQTCKDPQRYDALDLSQWEFYVVAAERVRLQEHEYRLGAQTCGPGAVQ
jgi:hypothetical protein